MLEDIALKFVNQSEDTLPLVFLGLVVVGAIIAAVVTRSETEIARAPYFAYDALIVFFFSAVQIVWLQSIPAVAGGYLWVLMLISFVASIAAGFLFCCIAMARSRDAYGHGRMAFLGFIPIAQLWLLFKPSKNEISANRAPSIRLLSGGLGILTGLVFLAASAGVTVYIEEQSRRIEQKAQGDPASQQASIELMIRSNGLDETLRLMAAEAQTPIMVDEVTTLVRIEGDGTQLRRTYVVDLEGMRMTDGFRAESRNGICAWPAFEPILRAGGSIREVYVERSGREIGAVMVTRQNCGI